MLNATPTPITPPRVPLIDPRTGLIERSWYMFFLSLFGAAQNTDDPLLAPDTNSLLASYDLALATVSQAALTQPPPSQVIPQDVVFPPAQDTKTLEQQIQDLQLAPIAQVLLPETVGAEYSYTGTTTGFSSYTIGGATGTITFARVGGIITLDLYGILGTTTAAQTSITGGPVEMRPATDKQVLVGTSNALTPYLAIAVIRTTGTIDFYKDIGGNPFSTYTADCGWTNTSVSYTLA